MLGKSDNYIVAHPGINDGLTIRQIIFGEAPKTVFETMMRHEQVHPVQHIDEFKERAGTRDRITLGLYRTQAPEDKPLAYIAVALTNGIVGSMRDILGTTRQVSAIPDTAIFYSINRTDGGAEKQIKPGAALIEHLFPYMQEHYPNVKTPSTLSPVPGLVGWLKQRLPLGVSPLDEHEARAFATVPEKSCRQEWTKISDAVLNHVG